MLAALRPYTEWYSDQGADCNASAGKDEVIERPLLKTIGFIDNFLQYGGNAGFNGLMVEAAISF